MGSKAQAKSSSETAKRMKAAGIVRKTTRCPVCNKMAPVPYPGNHKCKSAV